MTDLNIFMNTLPVSAGTNAKETFDCEFRTREGTSRAVFDLYNQRLKLYDLDSEDYARTLTEGTGTRPVNLPPVITKITVYARPGGAWARYGFDHEATIRGFFADGTDAALWALYTDLERGRDERGEEHDMFIKIARSKQTVTPRLDAEKFTCHRASVDDTAGLIELLKAIFPDYPTPLTEQYLGDRIEKKTSHFRYILDSQKNMVAAASAEIDHRSKNAELTDCATRPEARGQGLMAYLLWTIEQDLRELFNITDLYTIARADEVGMNCVFSKLGYTYDGRLVNNCRMPNGWESMNIWCKQAGERNS